MQTIVDGYFCEATCLNIEMSFKMINIALLCVCFQGMYISVWNNATVGSLSRVIHEFAAIWKWTMKLGIGLISNTASSIHWSRYICCHNLKHRKNPCRFRHLGYSVWTLPQMRTDYLPSIECPIASILESWSSGLNLSMSHMFWLSLLNRKSPCIALSTPNHWRKHCTEHIKW